MNKQALAFLTMFSLILMLSVYYVTLPSDTTSVMEETTATVKEEAKEETNSTDKTADTEEKQESKEDTSETAKSDATTLQTTIDEKKDEEINRSSSVIADTKSNDEEKKTALAVIDELKDAKSLQKSVVELLQKEGYQTAVEISENTCIVTVFEQKDDKNIAKKIMQKANEATNNKYLLEVTFK